MQRGEIWWVSLPPPAGSGPGYRRPAVIIQSDVFNASAISTVIIALLTSNTRLANARGNVYLPAGTGRIPRDSTINVSQILTVDRSFLIDMIGELPAETMREVNAGLQLVMAL